MKRNVKDVWHTNYYVGANFTGMYDMPVLSGTKKIPKSLIRFSDAINSSNNSFGSWVVPYEHDVYLERFWNNAEKYLPRLLKYEGIISWDFSMYRNMPLSLQYWNCFRGRLLGGLYERNGGVCIPNIRPSDSRSLKFNLLGVPRNTTVAMSTVGNLENPEDKEYFKHYVAEVVKQLNPSCIVVYGNANSQIFSSAIKTGIPIVEFESHIASVFNRRKNKEM